VRVQRTELFDHRVDDALRLGRRTRSELDVHDVSFFACGGAQMAQQRVDCFFAWTDDEGALRNGRPRGNNEAQTRALNWLTVLRPHAVPPADQRIALLSEMEHDGIVRCGRRDLHVLQRDFLVDPAQRLQPESEAIDYAPRDCARPQHFDLGQQRVVRRAQHLLRGGRLQPTGHGAPLVDQTHYCSRPELRLLTEHQITCGAHCQPGDRQDKNCTPAQNAERLAQIELLGRRLVASQQRSSVAARRECPPVSMRNEVGHTGLSAIQRVAMLITAASAPMMLPAGAM
jgi:hypothetical protein